MRKSWLSMLLALCLLLACAPAVAQTPAEDRAGNAIALPETVQTIVSLAPSITQVITDLGMADKLVAVDTYSAYLEGVPEGLPAFDMMVPDMEQLIALAPDVVLVSGMSLLEGEDPFAKLAEMGVCVAYVPSSASIDGILADTLFIGQVIGDEAGAQALNDALTNAIETYRVETDTPVPVYFEIGAEPQLYSFGTDTFLNEMIELLGGRNIFDDQEGWIVASEEAVLAADPAVIFTNEGWKDAPVEDILAREGWADIAAVANGKVFEIDGDASSQPNHRIVIALEEMAEALK